MFDSYHPDSAAHVEAASAEREPLPLPLDPRRSRLKLWLYRGAAIAFGLLLCLAAEGVCRICDFGRPTLCDDPFVGFSEVHPLFEVDPERHAYRICPSRRRFFAQESFPVEKGARTRRVFCLGGSTVKGEPYSIPTSFTTWLELALNTLDEQHDWDVINCGGVSYASYRLVPILQECLAYQPDLFLLCTGHNEFLEDRTYAHLKHPQAVVAAARQWSGQSRLVTLARHGVARLRGEPPLGDVDERPRLAGETDPILDYHDSLQAYHWDEEWRQGVVAHFEFNLRRMVSLAQCAGVPLVLIQPPSNLGGFPPLKSAHPRPLSEEQQQRFDQLVSAARESYRTDIRQSIALLTEALDIDPQHAATLYDLGQCYRVIGQPGRARTYLAAARDCDVVPLRMLSPLAEAMHTVAADSAVPLLNAQQLLEAETTDGILDDALLVDHIHPGFEGHRLIAGALLEQLAADGWLQLPDDWRRRVEPVWQQHFESLDYAYFAKGQRFLTNLEGWTQGRCAGPPAAERFPWRVRPADRKAFLRPTAP